MVITKEEHSFGLQKLNCGAMGDVVKPQWCQCFITSEFKASCAEVSINPYLLATIATEVSRFKLFFVASLQ